MKRKSLFLVVCFMFCIISCIILNTNCYAKAKKNSIKADTVYLFGEKIVFGKTKLKDTELDYREWDNKYVKASDTWISNGKTSSSILTGSQNVYVISPSGENSGILLDVVIKGNNFLDEAVIVGLQMDDAKEIENNNVTLSNKVAVKDLNKCFKTIKKVYNLKKQPLGDYDYKGKTNKMYMELNYSGKDLIQFHIGLSVIDIDKDSYNMDVIPKLTLTDFKNKEIVKDFKHVSIDGVDIYFGKTTIEDVKDKFTISEEYPGVVYNGKDDDTIKIYYYEETGLIRSIYVNDLRLHEVKWDNYKLDADKVAIFDTQIGINEDINHCMELRATNYDKGVGFKFDLENYNELVEERRDLKYE